MAFAKQYFSSYKSNNNLDYYLEIWVDGYTGGNPTEIKLGAGGPVISYDTDQEDRFSPILSSQCDLPFMVTGVGTEFFIRQLREIYKEKQVYLHLYRATSSTYTTTKPIWSGFLVMDLGSGEDVSFPYEQKLKFVDGLSLLKDLDFVDLSRTDTPPGDTIPLNERTQGNYDKLNMYYGPALYTFWIKEILKKVGAATTTEGVSINYGFTTAVNWYNGKMQNTNQNSDPLGLTKCVVTMFHEKNDQEVFTPENCYLVLKEILRHWGARITYWKHEFWIVQVPEYITNESGTLDNPDNINSRQYDLSGSLISSQDHLGDTYYTRYEQTIQTDKVSKIVGTQYNYLPMINNVDAQFLSFASNNYYGGFPYGNNAETQEIYQGTIVDPSTADFLFLSIPLDWVWDMGSSALVNGHTNGWHCQVRFNFFASQLLNGTVTTFYLQYNSSNGSYYWIPEIDWRPLGTESPNYKIKSRQLVESNYVGFEKQIPFVDDSGNAISMLGDWDFFLDIQKYGTTGSNPGSFICNFLGYGYQIRQFKPQTTIGSIPNPSGSGSTTSGTVSWSNTLEIPGTTNFSILPFSQLGFNAGTSTLDIRLITSSPFRGVLQALNTTAAATYGISLNTQIDNNTNTERYSFGTLLWGDAVQSFAIGALRVNTGTAFDKTDADGEWGRGILTGDKTFTELLIHEFLTGQLEVVISPSMRLVVGDSNKDVAISGVTRPRFVNPIGILRETRNGPDPVYFFRRGSFYSLYDEWDYEGYQILRDSVTSTTTTNDIGDLGGSQDSNPVSAAKIIGNVTDALSTNSTIASLRQTIASTGANVAVNGNFNVATGWTLGTGWSIDTTAQKAKFAATGSLSSLSQINLTEGTKYQVIFTIDITAGQLTVKAGTSGGSQVITVAGQYELYLLCEGSTSIVFQAGTTFTGSISQVSIADQKSLSSVPIESLGETVFKTNDTFNLVNSINGEVIPLTVTSNQGATDTAISVTSVPLFDDIGIDSVLLINQDDLSAQYQNKTKGTVAGFDITATGIEKSSINITDWLNSDTMTGAAVTNVPTALSVKNYVDGQVGASDTLQEVTDNGNTTTNSIMIGSSSSPSETLGVAGNIKLADGGQRNIIGPLNENLGIFANPNGSNEGILFSTDNGVTTEMILLNGGNLLIGTTTDSGDKLQVNGNIKLADGGQKNIIGAINNNLGIFANPNGTDEGILFSTDYGATTEMILLNGGNFGINTLLPTEKLHVVGDALITGDSHADAFKPAATGEPIKFKNFGSTEVGRFTDGGQLIVGNTAGFGIIHAYKSSSGVVGVTVQNGQEATNNGAAVYFKVAGSSSDYRKGGLIFVNNGTGYGRGDMYISLNTSTSGSSIADISSAKMIIRDTGKLNLPAYGSGSFTGTETYFLAVTSGGDVVEADSSALPGGPYLPLTGGTLTGALTGTNIVLGEGSTARSLRVYYSDASYVDVLGYGIEFNRGTSYIRPTSDGNKTMYFGVSGLKWNIIESNSTTHKWSNGATEKMRLTSGGNLGLGISSPSSILHISKAGGVVVKLGTSINTSEIEAREVGGGQSLILSASNSTDDIIIDDVGNTTLGGSLTGTTATFNDVFFGTTTYKGKLSWDTGKVLIGTSTANTDIVFIRNFNTELARITSGGNLLIGGTSDTDKLVVEDATAPNIRMYRSGTGQVWQQTIDSSGRYMLREAASAGGTKYVRLQIDDTGEVEVFNTFTGTSATFSGDVTLDNIIDSFGEILTFESNDLIAKGKHVHAEYGLWARSPIARSMGIDGTATILGLYTNTTEKARITSGGNLLIGTTTDNGDKLQIGVANSDPGFATDPNVATTIASTTNGDEVALQLFVNDGTNNIRSKYFVDDTELLAGFDVTYSSGLNGFAFKMIGSEKMRLSTNGNLLLGTTSDGGEKLQVAGNLLVNNSTAATTGTANVQAFFKGGSLFGGDYRDGQIAFGQSTGLSGAVGWDNSTAGVYLDNRYNNNTGFIAFRTKASAAVPNEAMRITGVGNLLIGSTSDNGAKLQVTGTSSFSDDVSFNDTAKALFGIGNDLQIVHDGFDSYINNFTGHLYIVNRADNKDIILQCDDGTGGVTPYITLDGSLNRIQIYKRTQLQDGVGLYFGTNTSDFIFHNGSNTFWTHQTGNLTIESNQDGGDIIFKSDNGTGGKADYITLDGSQTTINLQQIVLIGTTTNSGVYKLDVAGKARVQNAFELEDVLTLKQISTPSDPASGKSSIYMDSADGGIKVKINVGGTVVTRTIASFE